ncbi:MULTISPECIES: FtsK/SpoIIIE domain-containing protein [unclassified Crossiella]|uniref:FtsK/SpoIIIE domain-containing protein n=1 Tax=unclassified Crossiella TaxID=2620835 RepID=UPI001FFFA2FA|nr:MULTISPECIES: FtsK/SpoIIIE domain-containing protein [unclassified Crossiella]MCK2244013.1 AAA family ATPase [Crossiella sp. S99.2]MCK2257129.1 AAA family ATPase [Crossiella sp. S99.1]
MSGWQARPAAQRLRVTVGSTVDGQPVEVDLKPPSLGGIGAHGLLTGISAAVRLDLLHTLLGGLIGTHAPDTLQLVLVDGADEHLFEPYYRAPHLADHALAHGRSHLIEALAATSATRRRLLREHGMRTLHDYDRARHYRPELPVLLPLVVLVHRLSLIHREGPELTELLRTHCAAWRDHGIHLLVAEDRLADLPAELDGYFGFELASGDHGAELRVPGREPVPFTPAAPPEPTALVAGMPPPAGQWFAPPKEIDFGDLTSLVQTEDRGLQADLASRSSVLVGELLGPERGRSFQVPVQFGQVLVVGAERLGVPRVLRSFALGMTLHRTPRELRLYLLDFNGSALTGLGGLPHVRVAVSGADDSLRDKTRAELAELIKHREQLYHRCPTPEQRAETDEPTEIGVIVHGWPDPELHPELAHLLLRLVLRGQAVGVHVVLGLHRWADLEPRLHGAFRHRLELMLDDPDSSPLPGRAPRLGPMRGRTGTGQIFAIAEPRYAGRDLAPEIAAAWPHPVQRLTALPYQVVYAELTGDDRSHKLGLVEGSGLTFTLDTRHLACFGDPGSGRSTLIKTFLRGLVALKSPEQARVVGVDYRRTWFNAYCEGMLLEYIRDPGKLETVLAEIRQSLELRRTAEHGWKGPDLYLVIDDYDLLSTTSRHQLAPLLTDADKTGFHLVLAGRHPAQLDEVTKKLDRADTTVLTLSGGLKTPTPVTRIITRPLPPGRALTQRGWTEQTVQITWTE